MAVSAIPWWRIRFLLKNRFSNEDFLDVVRRASEKAPFNLRKPKILRLRAAAQNGPWTSNYWQIRGYSPPAVRRYYIGGTARTSYFKGKRAQVKRAGSAIYHEQQFSPWSYFCGNKLWALYRNSIMESELFGHEKGAYYDAKTQRIGQLDIEWWHSLSWWNRKACLCSYARFVLLRSVGRAVRLERLGSNTGIDLDFSILAANQSGFKQLSEGGYISREFVLSS